MKFFKKDTLTHGLIGGAIVAAGVGAAAFITGGVALAPAAAVVIGGTSLGALHGAGDKGGTCRKLMKDIAIYSIMGIASGLSGNSGDSQGTNNNNVG